MLRVGLSQLTSSLTALGSSALLILQPRTGVAGWAEWAMLSSLLNMSDSVPPAHRRLLTISHLFRRELRGVRNTESERERDGGRWRNREDLIICCDTNRLLTSGCGCLRDVWLAPSPLWGQSSDPPQLLQVDVSIFVPLHLYIQFTDQPLSLLWQTVSDKTYKHRHAALELSWITFAQTTKIFTSSHLLSLPAYALC